MKEIKTKQTIKDIKVLDKATDVSRRAKNAYIRTKKQSEQLAQNEDGNFVDDAGNNVREGAESVARKTGYTVANYGKKAMQKINENRRADTDAPYSDASDGSRTRLAPKTETSWQKLEHKTVLSEGKETTNQKEVNSGTKQVTERDAAPFKANKAVRQNISQPGAKQAAEQNAAQSRAKENVKRKYTLSKPNELAKRRFVQNRAKQRFAHTREIRVANQEAAQTQVRQVSGRITTQTVQRPLFQPAAKGAAQTIHTSGKTDYTIKRSIGAGGKTVTKAAKGTIKTAQRSVKTVEHTAKAAVKTSQAAKATANTAQASQRAAQAARTAARAAAVSTKTAWKATMASIKAIIAAVKGLFALIAAGSWVAFMIILVICLAGLLLGSGYGIFFSNENSGKNTPIMTEVVSQLNKEFTAKIKKIEDENPHDTLDLSINGSSSTVVGNWRDILAVYAVKVAADPENGMEVATIDNTKVGILYDIFWDMNRIDYWIETVEHVGTVTTTDKDGHVSEETITTTEIVLHIKVTSKSSSDMIAEYGFNAEQVKMLNELMQDEYQRLFMRLIGSNADITMVSYRFSNVPYIYCGIYG